jgi:hypothetical protein
MSNDPRRLRAVELCRLLNSTPLGEVVTERKLQTHRTRAGMRIGDHRRVDLVRYVAWLVHNRHSPKASPVAKEPASADLAPAAADAAGLAVASTDAKGGKRLAPRQAAAMAAILSEPTYAAAAVKIGVSEGTIYRWMNQAPFRDAMRRARRELVEAATSKTQAACGLAVDALLEVARSGRREGDRVRAATVILQHAMRGLSEADLIHGGRPVQPVGSVDTNEIVRLLAGRLRQIDDSELPATEKARLTTSLADSLMRAIGVDVLDKRLEALQAVLIGRKDSP